MTATETISAAFIAARRTGQALDAFPGVVPSSLDAAYAVQARSIADWGEPVVGYKVGGIGESWRDRYPSSWLAGPVFASHIIKATPDEVVDVPVYRGGFAAYEPELIFKLGSLSAPRGPVESVDVAKAFIHAVHLGAEIASSPLATLNDLGPGSIISDFGNQSAVVIGPQIDRGWLDRLGEMTVTTAIDDQSVGSTTVKPGEAGPLGALRFLLNHLRDHPPAGNPDSLWLSSGAITGVHQSEAGSVCTMDYHDIGSLRLCMVAHERPQTSKRLK